MPEPRHFSKEDIGGELLPILTTGLYRDSLDALREYIQNGIDANAAHIDVSIDPSTVAVTDDGEGMTRKQAELAIRLGISDKNPQLNIGFRGIGIYSAFNLCDSLEIFTKSARGVGSHILFRFADIRDELMKESERRKIGLAPKLFLEKLLKSHVLVQDDHAHVIRTHGSKVIMSGLLSDSYDRLQKWNEVEEYLQDVVPLPFHPDFKYGPLISQRFRQEDYRVVPLSLEIGSQRGSLFRPYSDELFPNGQSYPPEVFALKQGNEKFGFAWICINGRRVIKDSRMRGLLIKKFGFSVGDRGYLEPYFKRTVFNRRITGEIIVQHQELIPNAARSDFENNASRQQFLSLLPGFIAKVSSWADGIQQNEKAREVLIEVTAELEQIANDLPKRQRDKDAMLQYNVHLADLDHRLNTHKKTLQEIADLSQQHAAALTLLKQCQKLVRDALATSASSRKVLEDNVVKVIQAEVELEKASPASQEQTPLDLPAVLDGCGISLSKEAVKALRLFESEFLLEQIDSSEYRTLLKNLQKSLEEDQ